MGRKNRVESEIILEFTQPLQRPTQGTTQQQIKEEQEEVDSSKKFLAGTMESASHSWDKWNKMSRLLSWFLASATELRLPGSFRGVEGCGFAEPFRKGIPWAEASTGRRRRLVALWRVRGRGVTERMCSDSRAGTQLFSTWGNSVAEICGAAQGMTSARRTDKRDILNSRWLATGATWRLHK